MSASSHLSVLCMTLSETDVDWLRADVIAVVLSPTQTQQKLNDIPGQVKWVTVDPTVPRMQMTKLILLLKS